MPEEGARGPEFGAQDLVRWLLTRITAEGEALRSLRALPVDESRLIARRMFAEARGAKEIAEGFGKRGLIHQFERAHSFVAFSHALAGVKTVTIIPASSPDPKSPFVGGLGISDGQPANGVVVELSGTRLVRFTTLDFLEGKYSEKTFEPEDLIAKGIASGVERRKRGSVEPELAVNDAVTLATHAFRVLVTDDHSSAVHTPQEIGQFMHQSPIVSMIAELQYQRIQGLASSPDTSCCSCCCCCWGSCSSCSAVSSAYVNADYYRATA